jgi:hypothetical protein
VDENRELELLKKKSHEIVMELFFWKLKRRHVTAPLFDLWDVSLLLYE